MARGTKKGRPVKGGANVRWSGDKEGIDQEHDCGGPKRCGRDPNDLNDGFPILIKRRDCIISLHTSGLGSRLHRPSLGGEPGSRKITSQPKRLR